MIESIGCPSVRIDHQNNKAVLLNDSVRIDHQNIFLNEKDNSNINSNINSMMMKRSQKSMEKLEFWNRIQHAINN
jgi:hypothetical protein